MRVPRSYHQGELTEGDTVTLGETAANHLTRVLRLKVGAPLILFNGKGGEFDATITTIEKRRVDVSLNQFNPLERESPLHITLAQGISKGERMDYTIQKAVELGVNRIVPIQSERTVVNLRGERADKRLEHWRGVIISACEQCGRNSIPELLPVKTLQQWLEEDSANTRLLLDHRANHSIGTLKPFGQASLLIGPEGGMSEKEQESAYRAGYTGVRLGPRVLRTETAALVALAALQSRMGDLG